MRRADIPWATQRRPKLKERKPLVLIGIVCDDEIKYIKGLETQRDKSKMVFKS